MVRFIGRRIFFAIVTILLVSAAVFAIFSFLPFDPAALTCGQRCTPQIIEGNRIKLGFDKPIYNNIGSSYLEFLLAEHMALVLQPLAALHHPLVIHLMKMPA